MVTNSVSEPGRQEREHGGLETAGQALGKGNQGLTKVQLRSDYSGP